MPPKFKRHLGPDYDQAKAPERQALLDDQSEDDDFFYRGTSGRPDSKVSRLQGQVDEVIDVMQDNIGKVMDRGERLEDLQDKSDDLASNSDVFRMKARNLSHQMWWRECRMRIILALVVVVILIIIFVPIIVKTTRKP